MAGKETSQRVTDKDIESGQVRFPRPAKRRFPEAAEDVRVDLRGLLIDPCRWNPRTGPDRERSGVLRVGRRALAGRVESGDVFTVSRAGETIVLR